MSSVSHSKKIPSWVNRSIKTAKNLNILSSRYNSSLAEKILPETQSKDAWDIISSGSMFAIGLNEEDIQREALHLEIEAKSIIAGIEKNNIICPDNILMQLTSGRDIFPDSSCAENKIAFPKNATLIGKLARLKDQYFWRKKIRSFLREERELFFLHNEKIGISKKLTTTTGFSEYVSDAGLQDKKAALAKDEIFRDNFYIVNKSTNEKIALSDTTAQYKITQAKLLNRVNGIQNYADNMEMNAMFITLTAPPEYHPNPSGFKCRKTGKWIDVVNSWNGSRPKEAHRWIAKKWDLICKRLNRRQIPYIFLRATEPHKDGCPHWHVLLWCPQDARLTVRKILLEHWAEGAGCTIVNEKKNRGNAAAYIWKYILKNTSGMEGEENSAERVNAWRTMHSIYAFRFGGTLLPTGCIGQFDELQRLKTAPGNPITKKLWEAAQEKKPNFGKFLALSRGEKIFKYAWTENLNSYGEKTYSKIGLIDLFSGELLQSRVPGQFVLEKKENNFKGLHTGVNCIEESKEEKSKGISIDLSDKKYGMMGNLPQFEPNLFSISENLGPDDLPF
jgi:hypothetical protein